MIQGGFDKWAGSFVCGSAAVRRRSALATAGGFSGVSITEDAETALELHARGWHSAYVDRPMIAGLQPETFASFIGQRSRWAQGMLQIILLKRPFLKRGLRIPQRLCYMAASMFWLFPFARLTFLFAPLAYLFFSLQIFNASGAEFAAYTMPYMVINILIQNYLYSSFRWPFISELYETIQSVYLIKALGGVLVNPKKPTFKVTAKGETTTKSRISELGWPFYIIFFILAFAVLVPSGASGPSLTSPTSPSSWAAGTSSTSSSWGPPLVSSPNVGTCGRASASRSTARPRSSSVTRWCRPRSTTSR